MEVTTISCGSRGPRPLGIVALAEQIYSPNGDYKVQAVRLKPSDSGFAWVRSLSPARLQQLVDLGAALLEVRHQSRAKLTESKFNDLLEKHGVGRQAYEQLVSITGAKITLWDVLWCYQYASISKRLAEDPNLEFGEIDNVAAEELGCRRDEIVRRKARLDFSEMIAVFQEAQIDFSKGSLLIRKWHDAMRGDNTSASFFMSKKGSEDKITVTTDISSMSEAEIMAEMKRLRKTIGVVQSGDKDEPVDAEFEESPEPVREEASGAGE